jgi:hypothetical protein
MKYFKTFILPRQTLSISISLLIATASGPFTFAQMIQQPPGSTNLLSANLVKPLEDTMSYASTEVPSVHQQEKTIQSTHQTEVASILNSFKAGAYGGKTDEEAGVDTSINAKGTSVTANGIVNYAQGTALASLTTYFQAKGIQLTEKTQKTILDLLRMQEATTSAQSFISAITNQFSEYFSTIYIEELSQLQSRLEKSLTSSQVDRIPPSLNSKIGTLKNSRIKAMQTRDEQIAILRKFIDPTADKELVQSIRRETEAVLMAAMSNKSGPSLKWDNMENLFPVPESAEEALAQASRSPTIILAELNEQGAKNNWGLNLAAITPAFSISFTRNDNNQLAYPYKVTTPTDKKTIDNVWAGGFNMAVGAGFVNTMSAAQLAEQASKYGEQDAKVNLRSSLESYYSDLMASESSLRISADNIKNNMPKVQLEVGALDKIDRQNIQEALQDYTELESAVTSFNLAFNAQLTARLQILVATGQLLEQLQANAK